MKISRKDLDTMGRRQLQELVRMLRHDEHGHGIDGHHVADAKTREESDKSLLLQDRVSRSQREFRDGRNHHLGAKGLQNLAKEHAWRNPQRRYSTPEKRERAFQASIGYRSRWWNRHKPGAKTEDEGAVGGGLPITSATDVDAAAEDVEENEGLVETDASSLPRVSEDDIESHFKKSVLDALSARGGAYAPSSSTSAARRRVSSSTTPLALYRMYKNRSLDPETARDVARVLPVGADDVDVDDDDKVMRDDGQEETRRKGPVFYYGRSPEVTERVRRSISRKILRGEMVDDNASSLLSRTDNLGSEHSEKWYEDKLRAKEESMGGASPFAAGRRVSTWRDLTASEKAERERKAAALVRVKEEAERRRQLQREKDALEAKIAEEKRKRDAERSKATSMAARLESIKDAVRESAVDLWSEEY